MSYDLDLSSTDRTIYRDHLLIMDYLPTKFEACGAKRSGVISCTRSILAWPLTLTCDLNINKDHLLIKDYLPTSVKLLGQSVLELSVAWGEVDWHDLWPTDLNINRDHLLIKESLPTKSEAPRAKRSWAICCTRLRDTDILTDRPTEGGIITHENNTPMSIRCISYVTRYNKGLKYTFLFVWRNERPLVTCKSCEAQIFTRDHCPFISQCKQN